MGSTLTGKFIDLPKGQKIKTFRKWRDWVLMSIRQCCEKRGYEVGVGESDEEISTFIARLNPDSETIIIDNWCVPLLVAHTAGYLCDAKRFYQTLFPKSLTEKCKFVVLTRLHIEVVGSIIEGTNDSLLNCNI